MPSIHNIPDNAKNLFSPNRNQQTAAEIRQNTIFNSLTPVEFARTQIGSYGQRGNPEAFFRDFRQYPFTDHEKLEIAKIWPYYTEIYAHQFEFKNPDMRIKFVGIIVSESPYDAAQICRNFDISKQDDLIKIGNHVADTAPYFIHQFINKITIHSENERFGWACKMAQTDQCNFEYKLNHFKLTQPHQREAIFLAARSLSPDTYFSFKDHDCLMQSDKLQLLITLAEHAPMSCAYSVPNFPGIAENDRLELARMVGEKNAGALYNYICKFSLSNQSELVDLYTTYFTAFIQYSIKVYTKNYKRTNTKLDFKDLALKVAERIHNCTEEFFGSAVNAPGFQQQSHKLGIKLPCIAKFLDESRAVANPEFGIVLSKWSHYANLVLGQKEIPETLKGTITSALEAIFQLHQPKARYSLTNLLIKVVDPESADQCMAQTFNDISAALTKPYTRVFAPLLCALASDTFSAHQVITKYVPLLSNNGFKYISRQHNIVNGFLALIEAPHIENSQKQRLLTALTPTGTGSSYGKKDVKTFARAMQNLADFIPLTTQDKIKDIALQELSRIEITKDIDAAFGTLFMSILGRNPKADTLTDREFMQKVSQANEHFRRPNALLNYVSTLYAELKSGEEKQDIFKVLNQCVDTAILALSPQTTDSIASGATSQAFLEARNDISKSAHLQKSYALDSNGTHQFLTLEKEVDTVFETYGQSDSKINTTEYLYNRIVRDRHIPAGTFPIVEEILQHMQSAKITLQELSDLHTKASPTEKLLLEILNDKLNSKMKIKAIDQLLNSTEIGNINESTEFMNNLQDLRRILLQEGQANKNLKGWKLKFAHNFEDYLLCGTEVLGSCQSIEGSTENNKALMGYVMQGKNRIISLNSPDGTIQARCIIRLGIDETASQLVMHMEDSYHNPGVPGNHHEIFGSFARELSIAMGGIPIITHSSKYGATQSYKNHISFLPDTAACEYVDSEGLGVVNSREGYRFEDARLLL